MAAVELWTDQSPSPPSPQSSVLPFDETQLFIKPARAIGVMSYWRKLYMVINLMNCEKNGVEL